MYIIYKKTTTNYVINFVQSRVGCPGGRRKKKKLKKGKYKRLYTLGA